MYDVAIIGAGPIGLYLASLLEKKLSVIVLDKNSSFGGKADSGLYSARLESFIPLEKKWIEHHVTTAVLHSSGGEEVILKKPSTAAYVVNRKQFTAWLSERLSCPVKLKQTVQRISIKDTAIVDTQDNSYEAKMLIGCDGASSIVRKHFGISPKEILNGIIGITAEENHSPAVDLYFEKKLLMDGFFWKIPRGKTTEYGALGKNVNYNDLETFFRIKNYEKHAAFMNLGYFPTAFPHTLLVGEAAGQVKPWSLGGIIFGFTCSKIASDVIFDAFTHGDFSENFLNAYDISWKKKIGGIIQLGLFLREQYKKMDNNAVDETFRNLRQKKFLDSLDMDFPSLELFG